jgi:hypothetical protein
MVELMLGVLPEAADAIGGPPIPGDVDIEPLLVALLAGVLDDHLHRIAKVLNARVDALEAAADLDAASRLHVGDRVRLRHNLRPLYLHGRSGTITARRGGTWIVQLDEPVGRFTTGEIRVRSTQLDPRT